MQRPFEYTIICDKTKKVIRETNIAPLLHELQTWEPTSDPSIKELKQTRTCFVDTRYKAKLRLFNYLNGTTKYDPFKGTEIGKTLPILNF